MDEAREFIARYIVATPAQLDVMALWSASTHAMDAFVTHPRLLFTSDEPESGKTAALTMAKDLGHKGYDAGGTTYALKAKLYEAKGDITLAYDEISDLFGKSGMNKSSHPFATLLRKGYKRGATDSWSVGRVSEDISIFLPIALSGLRTAVPADVASRCITIEMKTATPKDYYDVRTGEVFAAHMSASLRAYVQSKEAEIYHFRGRGLHPKLTRRNLEIWEPLLAVASACGGHAWLCRAMSAFAELGLSKSDVPVLTPAQTVLRDLVKAAKAIQAASVAKVTEIYGADLREEMRRFGEPLYELMSDTALAMEMAIALGVKAHVITRKGDQARGWKVATIERVWDERRPAALDAFEVADETDPFAV